MSQWTKAERGSFSCTQFYDRNLAFYTVMLLHCHACVNMSFSAACEMPDLLGRSNNAKEIKSKLSCKIFNDSVNLIAWAQLLPLNVRYDMCELDVSRLELSLIWWHETRLLLSCNLPATVGFITSFYFKSTKLAVKCDSLKCIEILQMALQLSHLNFLNNIILQISIDPSQRLYQHTSYNQ
jgi:hypothetical protein